MMCVCHILIKITYLRTYLLKETVQLFVFGRILSTPIRYGLTPDASTLDRDNEIAGDTLTGANTSANLATQ